MKCDPFPTPATSQRLFAFHGFANALNYLWPLRVPGCFNHMKISLMLKQAGSAPAPPHKPQIVDLRKSYCIIGRSDSTVVLNDVRCSRQHCLLYENYQRELCMKDLGSTNGTFVNGQRAQETVLRVGDEIRIGKTLILILDFKPARDVATSPQTQAPAPTPVSSVPHRDDVKQEQTQTNTGILTSGPEKFFGSLAPQDKANFLHYVDEEGTQARIPMSQILKSSPKKNR